MSDLNIDPHLPIPAEETSLHVDDVRLNRRICHVCEGAEANLVWAWKNCPEGKTCPAWVGEENYDR